MGTGFKVQYNRVYMDGPHEGAVMPRSLHCGLRTARALRQVGGLLAPMFRDEEGHSFRIERVSIEPAPGEPQRSLFDNT